MNESNKHSTPNQQEDLESQIDQLLFAFADYIKHHAQTGLGGPDHHGTTRRKLMALVESYGDSRAADELESLPYRVSIWTAT